MQGDIEVSIEDIGDLESSNNEEFQTISLNTAFVEENFLRMRFESYEIFEEDETPDEPVDASI